jgi:hypothetical protein
LSTKNCSDCLKIIAVIAIIEFAQICIHMRNACINV